MSTLPTDMTIINSENSFKCKLDEYLAAFGLKLNINGSSLIF